MAKPDVRWIVTANFTADGAVAYRKSDGSWSRSLRDAGTFETEADALPWVGAAAKTEQRLVADPYAIDVGQGPDGIFALTARERIRAAGPTIPIRRSALG
jgi:Protein of unknown function (DUF2849)